MAEAVAGRSPANVTPWQISVIALILGTALVLAVFWPTALAAVRQWNSSSAYSYAHLIAPISLYLIWRVRDRLALLTPVAAIWCAGICAMFVAAWLVADALDIEEGRALAVMGMLQSLFFAVLGKRVYGALAFPLLYLWLLVPSGEFLLWPLQKISHAGAVILLELSGVPVFAEGVSIEVPTGRFLVEPGCAGLNFLLTSFALSLLYGYLFYRRWSARFLCVAVALITAILANILRIYLIIALAQFTHRTIDITDDHVIYGWGFFAVIMVAMMWFGARFATADSAVANKQSLTTRLTPTPNAVTTFAVAAVIVGIATTAPLIATVARAPLASLAAGITSYAPFLLKPVPTE